VVQEIPVYTILACDNSDFKYTEKFRNFGYCFLLLIGIVLLTYKVAKLSQGIFGSCLSRICDPLFLPVVQD